MNIALVKRGSLVAIFYILPSIRIKTEKTRLPAKEILIKVNLPIRNSRYKLIVGSAFSARFAYSQEKQVSHVTKCLIEILYKKPH